VPQLSSSVFAIVKG